MTDVRERVLPVVFSSIACAGWSLRGHESWWPHGWPVGLVRVVTRAYVRPMRAPRPVRGGSTPNGARVPDIPRRGGSVGFRCLLNHTRLETGETPQRGCRVQRLLELSAMYFKVDRSAGRYTRHNSGCRAQPRWHLH